MQGEKYHQKEKTAIVIEKRWEKRKPQRRSLRSEDLSYGNWSPSR
jgi:hypothetical protein